MKKATVTLGLDFGTESVCALLVDLRGRERASAATAIRALAALKQGPAPIFKPNIRHRATYNELYREDRRLGGFFNTKCPR